MKWHAALYNLLWVIRYDVQAMPMLREGLRRVTQASTVRVLKGNTVSGANNINVTNTTWGKNLVHTSIDDNLTLHGMLLKNLTDRMIV